MGCFSSKPKVVNPPPRGPSHVPLITRPQVSSTLPHNLQISSPHDPQGSSLTDVPSRPPQDTPRTRPQDPPTPPPQDMPRQPLPDAPSSPTPPPEPVSEPAPPPPYSFLPLQDPQPSTLDSPTLSIQNPQAPTPVLTTPPSDRSPPLTIPSTPSTVTESESPQPLNSSTTHPPVDVTELRSTSASQTPDPTTNSSTIVISPPQAPGNLARDQREQHVVQALKATLHRMRTTLAKAPSSVPRVQNFVKMNLDVVDLIESSEEHELQDFYDLMQEINAQFVALIDHFPIPEDLQRKIDSIARINEFVPVLSKLLEGRSPEHASIAGDGSLLPVVAQFLRRIKEELDSQASHATDRVASISASGSRGTFQQLEGGGGGGGFYPDQMSGNAEIDMQPRPRDARSPMTIVSTVPRPPSPDSHEDPRRASLPRCPPISPIGVSVFEKWNGETSARSQDPQIA